MSATPHTAAHGRRRGYGRLWIQAPGNAVYLIAGFVLAITALAVLAVLFFVGAGLIILIIGLPMMVAALFAARGFGVADRFLLRLTGLPEIAEPDWERSASRGDGAWQRLTRPMRNPHYWSYLLHGLLVSPIISTVTFAFAVAWIAGGLGGISYWFWGAFLPENDSPWGLYVADAIPWLFDGWSDFAIKAVLMLVGGAILTVTLPWVLGGLARAHHAVAERMLGRWRSDDLVAEVKAEAAARDAAVQAEDVALRRLERDIHDGPQQRLVRLQMDLAALERRAESGEGDAAADLAREARGHAKAALDELRALSSGVAPPLLQDRGLAAALAAVAADAALSVRTDIDPAIDAAVSPEVARTVYFVVAELLTNVVKHSGASQAIVTATLTRDAGSELAVRVVDNGRGGAAVTAGHGLEGLQQRMAGLRGTLVLDSPLGGPTSATVRVPLAAS